MLGHYVKFLKLWVCDTSTVDLVASAGPCSILPPPYPVELSAEQRLGGAAGCVTCGHLILSARVTSSFVMWVKCALLWTPMGTGCFVSNQKNHFGEESILKSSLAIVLAHQNCLAVITAVFCGRSNEVRQSIWWLQAPPDDSAPLLIDYLQCMQKRFQLPWTLVCLAGTGRSLMKLSLCCFHLWNTEVVLEKWWPCLPVD